MEDTLDIRDILLEQRKRTGVGGKTLLRNKTDVPEGLTISKTDRILYGYAKNIRADHAEYLLNELQKLPTVSDVNYWDVRNKGEKVSINLSLKKQNWPSVQELLHQYRERTGIGADRLLGLLKNIPEGLTPDNVRSWLSGKIKYARADHIDYVLLEWEKLPSVEYVTVTDEIRNTLQACYAETGISPDKLLKNKKDLPEDLSATKIRSIISERTGTIRADHLEYVMQEWQKFPKYRFVEVTNEIRAELQNLRHKTNIEPGRLLKGRRSEMPDLTTKIIEHILSGKKKTVRQDHLEYVVSLWRNLDEKYSEVAIITQEILDKLRGEIYRTRISPNRLIKNSKNVPHHLSGRVVMRWISGDIKEARKSHIEYLLARWAEYPNATRRKRHHAAPSIKRNYIELSNEIINELKFHHQRTGVGPTRLLRLIGNTNKGFNAAVLSNWINAGVKSVNKDHLECVLSAWQALSDRSELNPGHLYSCADGKSANRPRPSISALKAGREHISAEDLATLRFHHERTGMGAATLLRTTDSKPQDLNQYMITSWISGKTRTASPEHISFVLSLYSQAPSKKVAVTQAKPTVHSRSGMRGRLHLQKKNKLPITQKTLTELRAHCLRTGVGPKKLLRNIVEKPDGLSISMIASWIEGTTRSARPEHIAYVLECYAKLPSVERKSVEITEKPVRPVLVKKRLPERPVSIRKLSKRTSSKNSAPFKRDPRLSESELASLHSHHKRTGLGATRLLRKADNKPDGLNADIISGWLSGNRRTAKPEHIAYVLALYERAHTKSEKLQKSTHSEKLGSEKKRHHISEIQLEILRAHRERTGLNGTYLLRQATVQKPKGLLVDMINGWIKGTRRVAQPEHIAYVIELYETLPSQK